MLLLFGDVIAFLSIRILSHFYRRSPHKPTDAKLGNYNMAACSIAACFPQTGSRVSTGVVVSKPSKHD